MLGNSMVSYLICACLVALCASLPTGASADWLDTVKSVVDVPASNETPKANLCPPQPPQASSCLETVGKDPAKHGALVLCLEAEERVAQSVRDQQQAMLAEYAERAEQARAAGPMSILQIEANQTKLIRTFIESQGNLVDAQILLAQALGLKSQRELLEAEAKALATGNAEEGKESVKKLRAVTMEAQKVIRKRLDEIEELSPEAKVLLGKSLLPFAKSVLIAARMIPEGTALANDIKSQIMSANVFAAVKIKNALATGLFITPKLPGYLKDQTVQLRDLVLFAKKNGVKVPSEATDLI